MLLHAFCWISSFSRPSKEFQDQMIQRINLPIRVVFGSTTSSTSLEEGKRGFVSARRCKELCRSVVICQADKESRNQCLTNEIEKKHIPVLSPAEVMANLYGNLQESTHQKSYRAMYSSVVGGIITDPEMMLIPIDDHIFHRGHGVFDTALIMNSYLYELDAHLDRLLRSAAMAKIASPFSRSSLRDILVQTVASSNCRQGLLRYWLSAGPGGFDLSSSECNKASFYAIVVDHENTANLTGVKVITSTIPMKPPEFATMKSVNYLPNVLCKMEAESCGAFAGIWLDDEGFVAEGPNMNVAFVSLEGELLVPAFDNVLSGCTIKRMLALAPKLLAGNKNVQQDGAPTANNCQHGSLLKGIKIQQISVAEAKNAAEMMLVGSGVLIRPVINWDNMPIGNGQPGPVTLALINLIVDDMLNGPSTLRIPVHYSQD